MTILTYENTGDDAMVCQIVSLLGDGTDDLDGTGGEFELTLLFGGNTNQPDPQLITFSTATRASVFTEQFPLPVGETVTAKIKSPNPADTNVMVHTCIYEVGVESIRDELAAMQESLDAINVNLRSTHNVYDGTGGSGGAGVYPGTTGSTAGVYTSRC